MFAGPTEPVHCICFYRNQILSATTGNKIGLHTSVDEMVCAYVIWTFIWKHLFIYLFIYLVS